MRSYLLLMVTCGLCTALPPGGNSVEGDIQDLLEMVPFEGVLGVGMEYAIRDPQVYFPSTTKAFWSKVKQLVNYLSGTEFRKNVARLESSPQFSAAVTLADRYKINLYTLANKVNRMIDLPMLDRPRVKRSPGDGVMSFVQEAVEMTPLSEMEEVYRYKMNTNPKFKELVEDLIGEQGQRLLESMVGAEPLRETRKQLAELGLPVEELLVYLKDKFTFLFEALPEPSPQPLPVPLA